MFRKNVLLLESKCLVLTKRANSEPSKKTTKFILPFETRFFVGEGGGVGEYPRLFRSKQSNVLGYINLTKSGTNETFPFQVLKFIKFRLLHKNKV